MSHLTLSPNCKLIRSLLRWFFLFWPIWLRRQSSALITCNLQVVGGMCWCVQNCNVDIDVDLLFEENSTLGQQIALTEKIVRALKKMKCPHPLEPHQIQRSDWLRVFPVIQVVSCVRFLPTFSTYLFFSGLWNKWLAIGTKWWRIGAVLPCGNLTSNSKNRNTTVIGWFVHCWPGTLTMFGWVLFRCFFDTLRWLKKWCARFCTLWIIQWLEFRPLRINICSINGHVTPDIWSSSNWTTQK